MPRAALKLLVATLPLLLPAAPAAAVDPHLDASLVPAGCAACHRGHGRSRSPMLPAPQVQVCLACHDTQARADQQVLAGKLTPGARPVLLDAALNQPFLHPTDPEAFSSQEGVTCTSCHSPHRGMPEGRSDGSPAGRRYPSPKSAHRLEHELCGRCHSRPGGEGQGPAEVGNLLRPSNRSYHPVEAPSMGSSPSVVPALAGREINCTDCHGNSQPGGARGPHGSSQPFLLRQGYATSDGVQESPSAYALCYTCHRREAVLESAVFPEHRLHIEDERTSCATCHDPHGSVNSRSLIRFGEATPTPGVGPSLATGRLEFVSSGPGSGTCYLSCHGRDHAPEGYGALDDLRLQAPGGFGSQPPVGLEPPARRAPPPSRRTPQRLRPKPPR